MLLLLQTEKLLKWLLLPNIFPRKIHEYKALVEIGSLRKKPD